ncbi:MAG: ATP-binding protein [Desulfuromonadales bacterium]
MGLGMNIVKEIVDAHHGTIAIDSSLGKGTCVKITLPKK